MASLRRKQGNVACSVGSTTVNKVAASLMRRIRAVKKFLSSRLVMSSMRLWNW